MLKREKHTIPAFVKTALNEVGLMSAYKARPPYQQNDYIGWITRTARDETKINRINQMIDELKRGNVYMKMRWNPSRPK